MKETQELLDRTRQILDRTEELMERTQPILQNLKTFLSELTQLRTQLKEQGQYFQDHLSGLETTTKLAVDADTRLPGSNGAVHHEPRQDIDSDSLKDMEEAPELPGLSVSLAEFELPWESSRLSALGVSAPSSSKLPLPARQPSGSPASTERRASPRRTGNPTSVTITIGEDTLSGWVVDRSTLGVGMLVDDALDQGTLVFIKPNAAPPECPSVEGEVRHCQPEKGQYRVGLKFTNPLSWQHVRYYG